MSTQPAENTASQRSGVLLAVVAFAVFATHDALIKHLGSNYSVIQIMFFSVLFGFPPIALSMSASRSLENFRPHHPWWLAARMVCTVLGMTSAFYAFTTLPLAEAYAILFATPLLITALSVPLLGEVVRLKRWIAIAVGLAGVMIVLRPATTELALGHGAALIAAIVAAFASIIVRKIGPDERSAVLVLYPLTAMLVCMGALLPFVYVPTPLPDLAIMAVIGMMAFAAQFAIIGAYKLASATLIAPMQYSQIIWATLFGALFFDEFPDMWVGVGALVIIASGTYIVLRESKATVSEEKPVLRTTNYRIFSGVGLDPRGKRRGGIFRRGKSGAAGE